MQDDREINESKTRANKWGWRLSVLSSMVPYENAMKTYCYGESNVFISLFFIKRIVFYVAETEKYSWGIFPCRLLCLSVSESVILTSTRSFVSSSLVISLVLIHNVDVFLLLFNLFVLSVYSSWFFNVDWCVLTARLASL